MANERTKESSRLVSKIEDTSKFQSPLNIKYNTSESSKFQNQIKFNISDTSKF